MREAKRLPLRLRRSGRQVGDPKPTQLRSSLNGNDQRLLSSWLPPGGSCHDEISASQNRYFIVTDEGWRWLKVIDCPVKWYKPKQMPLIQLHLFTNLSPPLIRLFYQPVPKCRLIKNPASPRGKPRGSCRSWFHSTPATAAWLPPGGSCHDEISASRNRYFIVTDEGRRWLKVIDCSAEWWKPKHIPFIQLHSLTNLSPPLISLFYQPVPKCRLIKNPASPRGKPRGRNRKRFITNAPRCPGSFGSPGWRPLQRRGHLSNRPIILAVWCAVSSPGGVGNCRIRTGFAASLEKD